MSETELTEEQIAAAMAKADARVCVRSNRCYAFPDRLQDTRETCTPQGRCKVGWVVSRGGRESVVRTRLAGVGAVSGMWGMTRSNQVEAKGPPNRCLTPRECAEWCRSGRYTYDPTRNHGCMEACLNAQC